MKFVGAPKTEQQKRKHHDQESKEEKRERKVFMCYSGFHCIFLCICHIVVCVIVCGQSSCFFQDACKI
ncbi:hypothetical protein CISIN_1g035332mg [Citrus sinensis]|uniref:Uncharacterized protein n=1 Tax=Citrus sinensis TaxID=2711 RepID=A0A067GYG6_CITSI|nr:hypothetical protein CISIN_1g035332mg [Citrus sinensis]